MISRSTRMNHEAGGGVCGNDNWHVVFAGSRRGDASHEAGGLAAANASAAARRPATSRAEAKATVTAAMAVAASPAQPRPGTRRRVQPARQQCRPINDGFSRDVLLAQLDICSARQGRQTRFWPIIDESRGTGPAVAQRRPHVHDARLWHGFYPWWRQSRAASGNAFLVQPDGAVRSKPARRSDRAEHGPVAKQLLEARLEPPFRHGVDC